MTGKNWEDKTAEQMQASSFHRCPKTRGVKGTPAIFV
jgi:hypothetical protein